MTASAFFFGALDDVAAFEAIFEDHHRLVLGIARRILQDQRAAEDVAQAVFLKLWSRRHHFVDGNVMGWLSRVTRNEAIDVVRRARQPASGTIYETRDVEDMFDVFDQVSSLLEAGPTRLMVSQALERLPIAQREALELGFFGGLTHVEISRALQVPLGTVKTRIRGGLQRLRAQLVCTPNLISDPFAERLSPIRAGLPAV